MNRTFCLTPLVGGLATAFCLATLTPLASNEAAAQGIRIGFAQPYYNGYGAGYASGYQTGYGGYGYASNRYISNGTGGMGYTGYGNGPYGYGSPGIIGYPSAGYFGSRSGASYNIVYPGLRYNDGSYGRIYAPNNVRYYSPYGNAGY